VVQPDISVVCDDRKLDDKGCKGAPDLIVEVLSPSTWQKDRIEKMNLYQKHGVREYLLIYPNEKILEQYILNESGSYDVPKIYTAEETFTSSLFSDFALNMPVLFS
jgi:Uma2 family endonuclease